MLLLFPLSSGSGDDDDETAGDNVGTEKGDLTLPNVTGIPLSPEKLSVFVCAILCLPFLFDPILTAGKISNFVGRLVGTTSSVGDFTVGYLGDFTGDGVSGDVGNDAGNWLQGESDAVFSSFWFSRLLCLLWWRWW